ncbi:MAG: ABC transporter permease, partial [Acidimicrobiia bacterium]
VENDDPAAHLRSIHGQSSTRDYLASMWDRWEFALEVPREELRAAHQNTLLGNIWHLFNPLLTVGVYYLIFGVIFEVNRGVDDFLIWLTIGIFAFRLTSSTVLGGANAISSNAGLIRAMRFPRALLPISTTVSNLMTFLIELGIVAVMVLFFTDSGISMRWLALPAVMAVHTAVNLAGAFIAARLNDAFKDVQQIIPFVFRLLMYLSGVMFPLSYLVDALGGHPAVQTLIELNPIARIIEMYRWVFLGTSYDWGGMLTTALLAAAILWFAFRFFRAAEWRYGRA